MEKIYICLPVYNEEDLLENCMDSINESVKFIPNYFIKIFVCLNECSDKSEEIAKLCLKKYPRLNINISKSKKGKLNAQEKILSRISLNRKIFFIDADTEVDKKSFKIIIDEFKEHKELIAVGAFPIAKKYKGFNPWKRFLDNTLNIRSRHPKSEISKLDVSKYHKLAIKNPQRINTTKEHELNSKIFFHGRMFALRSKKHWNRSSENKNVVGDDSYLPDYIIYNHGEGRIRIRYDAIVYFEPFTSLKDHYKTYKRIYFDLKNLRDNFPEFREIRDHSRLILDKEYIQKQTFKTRFYFFCFDLIRRIEGIFFNISVEKDPNKIWKNYIL